MSKQNIVILLVTVLSGIQLVVGQNVTRVEGSDVINNSSANSRVCINGNYTPAASGPFLSTAEKCTSGILIESSGFSAVYNLKNNQMLNQINSNVNNLAASVNANTEAFKAMQAEIKKQNEEFNGKIQKSIVNRFDALPSTILSQIRTNADFRQEVIKLLLTDEAFKAELTQIKKEIVEEIKSNVSSVPQSKNIKLASKSNTKFSKRKITRLAKNTR